MIRTYDPQDRGSIREICVDTAFLGNPIDPIFSDRNLFADMIVGYYLRKEPKHTFVAEVDGDVVGYLTGSMSKHAHLGIAVNGMKPTVKAVARLLTRKYREHPQNKEFLKWLFFRAPFEIPKHPKKAAHAHFNIREGYRDSGIGTKVLEMFFEEMRRKGICKVYGEVFAHPQKPEEYFRDMSFDIYDKKETTLFRDHLESPAYLLCITKEIKS